MDKFPKMAELLRRSHKIIDTGVLKDSHREILNNLELGIFGDKAFSIVLLEKDVYRPPHVHDTSNAEFYFIEGSGFVILDGKEVPFFKGTSLVVPKGVSHGFRVTEDTLMLSSQDAGGILKHDKSIDFRYALQATPNDVVVEESNASRPEYPHIKRNSLSGQVFYLLLNRNAHSQETAVGLQDIYTHLHEFRGGGTHSGGAEDTVISRLRKILQSTAETPYELESFKPKGGKSERIYWLKKKG